MLSDPPLTRVEEAELASIPPDAREVFYRTVRRRWYAQAALGTLVGWVVEYTTWGFDPVWPFAIPLLLMAVWVRRKRWDRQTDYGALAKAKLAMDSDWPAWKRHSDFDEELVEIRKRNPARDGMNP